MNEPKLRPQVVLAAAIGIAAALVVGYPVSGWLAENYQTGRSAEELAAFHLAKAGVDRGLWQINQKKVNLDALLDGSVVPGLDNDTVYTDAPGGKYKVSARYDASQKAFRIIGTGIEASGRKTAIELVVLQRPDDEGLIQRLWREVPVEG